MLASTPPPCLRTPPAHQRTQTHNPYRRPPMSPLRAVSTPTPSTASGADTPMHSPSPLRQRIMLDQPRFPRVVHRPAFPSLPSPRRQQLEPGAALTTPTNSSFPPRRPLTRLCSDTTFAQPLVPLSDSDSDGSDLELDLDGDSVIRDIGIEHDVEIHDVDPDEGQDVSILEGADDEEGDQSWHTAPPFTPRDMGFSFFRSDDLPSRSNLTRTPSTRPTGLAPDDMQPPKAKRRSLDFSTAASTMPKFLLTPSRTRHREPAPERSSPPETSSPASPTARKHRLGLPLPRTPGAENQTWHGGMDVNSESIRKMSLIDDEYNPGSDSDSPSIMFPTTTKGKGRTLDPSTRIFKVTRRSTGGIFADPGAGTIPITEQVPSADPTSPFVLQTAVSNAPEGFVAPSFSLSTFSPPRTSSPYKTKPRRKGGLFENEMSFGIGEDEGEMENEMFPPIATSSPGPRRAPKRAPLASMPRLNVDSPLHAGHVTFSGVSGLLSGPLKKKYKARDSSAIGDESIMEDGPALGASGGKPHTRARTMSFQRGNLPNVLVNLNLPKSDDDLVTPQPGPGTASAWPDVNNSDDQDLDDEIFKSMVSHTSFSVEGTGVGGGGSGMPDTPVKKMIFGGAGASGGGPIAMGGARGWMTSLPDRGGKAFGGRNAPRPSLPIRFPELSPDSLDESPAAGRSKLPTIDSANESPTMRPFWNPAGADESPSLRPRRKSGETSNLSRRKSAGGDISLNLGVRKQKAADSPKRPPLGPQRRSYGSLGLGRPGGRERDPIPKFSFDENQENGLGLSTGDESPKIGGGPLVASTSANSFLGPSGSLGVMPFMRRASSGTFSSDGEASVSGTPTRRGAASMRGGLGGPSRPNQPVGARHVQAPSARPAAPGRSSLPLANWRLVTPSPSLSSLASMDTPSAPARKAARASPILSKGKRSSVPVPAFPPAAVDPEPTVTLGRLEREYTTVQQIGKGTFGQVLKVEKDGRLFAVKRSKAFEGVRHRRRVLEEVDILRHLATGGHSNILKFEDAWEQDGRSLILTEMCELGNLADFLVEWGERFARLDEPRVWKMASDLSHGLAFIHAAGVIHLDLKPANMFVTIEGRIRIGDFGMAARWPRPGPEVDSDGFEREGDRDYMAPEILRGAYGFEADVFCLGMTLLECAANIIVPAMGEPWHKLRNDDFSDVDLDGFSPELISLISSMMRREAGQRPSMSLVCAHECIVRTESIMSRAIEHARASSTNVFRVSPFGSEGPAFLEEVLGRGQMDMS